MTTVIRVHAQYFRVNNDHSTLVTTVLRVYAQYFRVDNDHSTVVTTILYLGSMMTKALQGP